MEVTKDWRYKTQNTLNKSYVLCFEKKHAIC